MKIAVWGAGTIGLSLVQRLATTSFVSEVAWVNRKFDRIEKASLDINHGLSLAPACREVIPHRQQRAHEALHDADIAILTHGDGPPRGKPREAAFPGNAVIFREGAVRALQGYAGIVIVVTNPMDWMTLLVQRETRIPDKRVIGLGTVVETSRMRASLSSYLSPRMPAREYAAFAVGTHDEDFIPVMTSSLAPGIPRDGELSGLRRAVRAEVVQGATRVKEGGHLPGTCYPVVEGVVRVVSAIAQDRHETLTVSTLDPIRQVCYSVPCTLGREGVIRRRMDLITDPASRIELEACAEKLRAKIAAAGFISQQG